MLFLGNLLLYVCISVSVQQKTHTILPCHTGKFILTFIQSLSSLCLPFLKFLVVFSFHVRSPLYHLLIFFSFIRFFTPQFLPINTFLTYCQIPPAVCPEGDREHAVEQIEHHIQHTGHAAQKDG